MTPVRELPVDYDSVLQYEPEELARLLLEWLNRRTWNQDLNCLSVVRHLKGRLQDVTKENQEAILKAYAEAWKWLENESMIAGEWNPDTIAGRCNFITRKGLAAASQDGFSKIRNANSLPRELLHENHRQNVWPLFLRGQYETAVFDAFRSVEVAVRKAGGYSNNDYGAEMMRAAFKPNVGPLANAEAPLGEQESLSHLFAGAFGYFRNPVSHREAVINDPQEAAQMIVLASHLLRIVDIRFSATQ